MPIQSWQPRSPYRFDLLLDFLARFAYPTLDTVRENAYWRAVRAGGGLALFRVTGSGSLDNPRLDVHLVAQTGSINLDTALEALRRILYLDADRGAFYDAARGDGLLWGIIEPLVGMPGLRSASVFEALAQTIIEQQIAWVTAQRAQRWLVEWAGNRITDGHTTHYVFPTPEQIAAASVDDLKPLKITFKRMGLLLTLARQVVSGELDLEGLRGQAPDTAYQVLMGIKGIGHWTAAVTLERAWGHYRVAYNDVVLQAATNRYFFGGQGRIPAERVAETFAQYDSFGGLAAHFTMLRWVMDEYRRRG
jgi:DNA-3-methyladenine glycosylase II